MARNAEHFNLQLDINWVETKALKIVNHNHVTPLQRLEWSTTVDVITYPFYTFNVGLDNLR